MRAWKESSVVLWCEEGGGKMGGRQVSLHHKGSGRWVGGWRESQCAALNPPQEERLALENSTNPVYQVSSQHSGRHTVLRVKERRARILGSKATMLEQAEE